MSDSRPYLNTLTNDLRQLAAESHDDVHTLRLIQEELLHRTKPAAIALRAKVEAAMATALNVKDPSRIQNDFFATASSSSSTFGPSIPIAPASVAKHPDTELTLEPKIYDADQYPEVIATKTKTEELSPQGFSTEATSETVKQAAALLKVSEQADWATIEAARQRLVRGSDPAMLSRKPAHIQTEAQHLARSANRASQVLAEFRKLDSRVRPPVASAKSTQEPSSDAGQQSA